MPRTKPVGSRQFWSDSFARHNRAGCDAFQQEFFKHLAGAGPEPVAAHYGVPTIEAERLRAEARRQRAEEDRRLKTADNGLKA